MMASPRRAMVVVLGDLARSPRMQYHSVSLAKNGYQVTVIANGGGPNGDKSCEGLESSRDIKQMLMTDKMNYNKFLPAVLAYLLKPIWQTLLLTIQLIWAPKPHVILIQNPPSIPTVPILYLYSCLAGSRLIIDWHNYGYTILRHNMKGDRLFVRLYKFIEFYFGRLADAGFCVSLAMLNDLKQNHSVTYPLHVLHDKPPAHFEPLSPTARQEFFRAIQDQVPALKMMLQRHKPALLLSSTSWTEDEDFDVLLAALQTYDQRASHDSKLPKLICVITGKGPLKAHYERKIADEMNLKNIEIVLPWLTSDDYPKMVGAADVGVSLHSSSSRVDLPMKVVDMFGCGVPVLAYREPEYCAISELVKENRYGLTFESSLDLSEKMCTLLARRDGEKSDGELPPLARYRENIIRDFSGSRWESNWNQVAKPVVDTLTHMTPRLATE